MKYIRLAKKLQQLRMEGKRICIEYKPKSYGKQKLWCFYDVRRPHFNTIRNIENMSIGNVLKITPVEYSYNDNDHDSYITYGDYKDDDECLIIVGINR
tara:strand:- start:71 stop:364 length:294 start_codon:yes stop_codon:yes gene_type:complete